MNGTERTPWLIPNLGLVRRYRAARTRFWAWLACLTIAQVRRTATPKVHSPESPTTPP